METNRIIFFSVIVYGVFCIFIGSRAKSLSASDEGYFVGGRSFGLVMTVCSVVMGIFSGLAFYGFPAFMFRAGIGTMATAGFGIIGVMYPFVGYKLWKIGKDRGYLTTADFLRERYYSEGFGIMIALLQIIFIVPYLTLQFVALGTGLSVSSNQFVSYETAVVIFAIFIAIYVYLGGAKGLGWLDIFNALLALVIPVAAVFYIINKNFDGSWSSMGDRMVANFPNMMDLPSFGNAFSGLNILALMLVGMIATFTSPHIISKFYMAKSRKTFQQMTIAAPLLFCWIGMSLAVMAWIGIAIYKPVLPAAQSDLLVPKLLLEHTSPIVVIGMLWVLFAFATSTANAFALSAATIFSNDLLGRYAFKHVQDERRKRALTLKIGKLAVIGILALVVYVALKKPAYIVDYAYRFAIPGFAQIFPALIFAMYWKRASRQAALAGTITGLATLFVTLFVCKSPFAIHPVIWSLGVNFVLFWAVTAVTRPSDEIVASFHSKYEMS